MAGLSPEQIRELLKPKELYELEPQSGPLRRFDVEMRCANRGCGSSTYCKVEGVPRCTTHALSLLNEMLTEGSNAENYL